MKLLINLILLLISFSTNALIIEEGNWDKLSFDQKERLIKSYRRFKKLPENKKKAIEKEIYKISKMDNAKQKNVLYNFRQIRRLSIRHQKKLLKVIREYAILSDEEKKEFTRASFKARFNRFIIRSNRVRRSRFRRKLLR